MNFGGHNSMHVTTKLISTAVSLFYNSTNGVEGLQFPHMLGNSSYFVFLLVAILMDGRYDYGPSCGTWDT